MIAASSAMMAASVANSGSSGCEVGDLPTGAAQVILFWLLSSLVGGYLLRNRRDCFTEVWEAAVGWGLLICIGEFVAFGLLVLVRIAFF